MEPFVGNGNLIKKTCQILIVSAESQQNQKEKMVLGVLWQVFHLVVFVSIPFHNTYTPCLFQVLHSMVIIFLGSVDIPFDKKDSPWFFASIPFYKKHIPWFLVSIPFHNKYISRFLKSILFHSKHIALFLLSIPFSSMHNSWSMFSDLYEY